MGHFYSCNDFVENIFLTTIFRIDWKKLALRAFHIFFADATEFFRSCRYLYIQWCDVMSFDSWLFFFALSWRFSIHEKNAITSIFCAFLSHLSPQSFLQQQPVEYELIFRAANESEHDKVLQFLREHFFSTEPINRGKISLIASASRQHDSRYRCK